MYKVDTRYKISVVCMLTLLGLMSCTHNIDLQTISPNLDNVQEVLIDSDNLIELETNTNSLLYDIGHIEQIGEKYFIFSRNVVRVFDIHGKYLFNLSQKGESPKEYLTMHNLFIDKENICIYDFAASRILKFDANGNYLSDITIRRRTDEPQPSKVFYIDDDSYLTLNAYAGNKSIPVFSIWNKDFNRQEIVKGRILQTGIRLADGCLVDGNKRILYWEPAKDTLFYMNNHNLEPLYRINFGSCAIPERIAQKDDYDRIMFLAEKDNIGYASMARFYQTWNNKLFFTFMYDDRICLCSFDEITKSTSVFSFIDAKHNYKLCPFFKIINDELLLELEDTRDEDKNHLLYKLPINNLSIVQ